MEFQSYIRSFVSLWDYSTSWQGFVYDSVWFNPLTTDDAIWRRLTLAACYQLAQSVLKIGFACASKKGGIGGVNLASLWGPLTSHIQHVFWHCGMGSWVGLPAHLPPWVQTARRLFITLWVACCLPPLGVSCGGPAHTCMPPPHMLPCLGRQEGVTWYPLVRPGSSSPWGARCGGPLGPTLGQTCHASCLLTN